MDTKAMTLERLAEIASGLQVYNEDLAVDPFGTMKHADGEHLLEAANELLSEVRRLRAVKAKAKKAIQTLDEMAGELMLTLKHDEFCQIRLAAPHLTVVCDCGASKAKGWVRTLRQYTMDIARNTAAPSFLEDGT